MSILNSINNSSHISYLILEESSNEFVQIMRLKIHLKQLFNTSTPSCSDRNTYKSYSILYKQDQHL